MNTRITALIFFAALFAAPRGAFAHILLMNPKPLTTDANAKSGPCGCYFGAGPEDPNDDATASPCPPDFKPTELVPGSKLQVTWKETVDHTGKFRLSLSQKPIETVTRADMDAALVYEADDMNSQAGGLISTTITVPEEPCDGCVLQLRQFMAGAEKPYYFSCAAITIKGAGSSSGSGGGGGAGGGGGSGSGAGAGGESEGEGGSVGPGPAPIPPTTASGACSVSSADSGVPSAALGVAAGFAIALIARRRRSLA
jgi:MYXO-CTERM domain-containing protein